MFGQQAHLYQSHRLLIDTQLIFSYGKKNINNTNTNYSTDGFEHNANFCLARYNKKGKKIQEVIVDKKRDFIKNSKLVKKNNHYYTLLEFRTRNANKNIFFNTLFFIAFDSTGKIIKEKILLDSSFFGFNHVYFGEKYIYVLIRENKLLILKYDYDFKLLETSTNPNLLGFFYDTPSDEVETNSSIINVGPYAVIDSTNFDVNSNPPVVFEQKRNWYIKETEKKLENISTVTLIPVSGAKLLSKDNGIYFLICDFYGKKNEQIFKYNSKSKKLTLVTDTLIDKKYKVSHFYAINNIEYILVKDIVALDINKSIPKTILYYIKSGKVICRTELKRKEKYLLDECVLVNNNLFIYETNTFGGDINVRVWNYIKCKIDN